MIVHCTDLYFVLFQKISLPPPWMVFWFETPFPFGNSSLITLYFHLKILAF